MKSLRGLCRTMGSPFPRNAAALFGMSSGAGGSYSSIIRWKSSGPGPSSRVEKDTFDADDVTKTTRRVPVHSQAEKHTGSARSGDLLQPMRDVMRQIPHPVVVITTLDNTYRQQLDSNTPLEDKDLKRPVPRAMTVSSMTSLCIKPIPRVAFNVTLPSTTYNAIRSCGVFNVHILAGSEHGARVADLFTRGNYRRVDAQAAGPDGGVFEGLMELDVQVQGRDAWEQEFDQEATGRPLCNRDDPLDAVMSVPLLQGKGIMHVLRCTLYRRADEIDQNAIVVGDVRDIVAGEQAPEGAHALVYVDRAYRRIGEPLLDRSPVADKAIRPEEPVEAGGVEGSGRQTNGNNG